MNGGKIADDAKDAKQAMNAYNKVMADGPEALVGSFFSSVTLPMAEQAAKDGMLLLATRATNSAVTLKGDTIFRNCFIDPYQGKMAALFVKGKGLTKVAVIYAKDDDDSNGLKDAFVENCESSGIEVAYVGECMTTDTDFSSQTAQAVASGAEFLYYPCFLDTVPLFVGAARNAGFTGIIMGGDGWDGSDTTGLEDKFEGCYFTNHYSSEDTAPAVVNFVEKFTAKYGTESLNACAALYYDAMYMLVEAAKNGGGTDTASLIAGMKGMSFTGVGGDITLYGLLASMFFALTFILNRSMNLGGAAAKAKSGPGNSPGNPRPARNLAGMEHGGLRPVLRAAFHGLLLWRVLVRRRHLADHHSGRRAADTPVRRKNPGEKSAVFRCHSAGHLPAPAAPSGKHGIWRLPEGTGADPRRRHFLSAGKPEDDGALPRRYFHHPACLRNDVVQYALLAAVLRVCAAHPWTSFLRADSPVPERCAVLRRDCYVAVL